jgi:molybdate transport system substrate-binding protein
MHRTRARRRTLVVIVGVAALVAVRTPTVVAADTVSVFAAASLADAFGALAKLLEQQHPEWRVETQFAGSQQIAAQIEQGAKADVFASADQAWMRHLAERGRLAEPAREFARNRLVVITPRAGAHRVGRLEDLAKPGVKLVLGAEAVPIGRYSREVLGKLAAAPGFGADFAERVLRNVVSQEENVKGVIAKVQLDEADAGIVYASDVSPKVADAVTMISIPAESNVIASYPIAVVKNAPNPAGARAFVALVFSPEGMAILRTHLLVPVAP